jgi:hypothetical protein
MKSILLASALWLFLAFLIAVFVGKVIEGVRRRHWPQPDRPSSDSTEARGDPGRTGEETLTSPWKMLSHPLSHKEVPTMSDLQSLIELEKYRTLKKTEKVRTVSGLQLLIERYTAQMKELETRMADARHKQEILLEASRLLEQEGLSEDNTQPAGDEKTSSK